jgi:hypothetical protein
MQQSGQLVTARLAAPAARVVAEVEAAMRQQLGTRSLKDLIAAD